jgi:hypothetical protein
VVSTYTDKDTQRQLDNAIKERERIDKNILDIENEKQMLTASKVA